MEIDTGFINFREFIPLMSFISGNHRLSGDDRWYRKYNQVLCCLQRLRESPLPIIVQS